METKITIYTIIGLMAIGQLFLLILSIIKDILWKKISTLFFFLLCALSYMLIHDILVHSRIMLKVPYLLFTGEVLTLIIWPLIYLITKKMLNRKISYFDVFHFLPFFIFQLSRIRVYKLPTSEKYNLLVSFYKTIDSNNIVTLRDFVWNDFMYDLLIFRLQPLIYTVVIILFLNKNLNTENKDKNAKKLIWLQIIIYSFFVLWFVKYFTYLLGYTSVPFSPKNSLSIIFLAVQSILISMFTLTNYGVTSSILINKKSIIDFKNIADDANAIMLNYDLFLDKHLTLQILAKKLNTNSNYLSKSINKTFNLNFADFVNQFRVEYAKNIINDINNDIYTLEALSHKCGFNSLSTFNRAFLKHENITPSHYRKKRLVNS